MVKRNGKINYWKSYNGFIVLDFQTIKKGYHNITKTEATKKLFTIYATHILYLKYVQVTFKLCLHYSFPLNRNLSYKV